MTVANFFKHLCADMLQGHHVSKAQTTSFQFRLWVKTIAMALLLLHSACQHRDRARLDNRQDSLNVNPTPRNRPSDCNVQHFVKLLTQDLLLPLLLSPFHKSSFFVSFFPVDMATHISRCLLWPPHHTRHTPSSFRLPPPPKIER